MKEHEDRDGCNKTATKPSTSERISVLPSAIDDLIQVVERGNVEEIKERPQKRAASIAASQALGVLSVPALPRNAAPPSPERGRKRNKT